MRLRSGVALAILLCASLSAFYVSLIGQRHVIGSSINMRMIDRIMVTLADFSLAFDEIKRNPRSQAAVRSEARLRLGYRIGEEAVGNLEFSHQNHRHSEETLRILSNETLNPIDEFQEVLDIVNLTLHEGRSEQQRIRAANLGAELSRQLIPVYLRLTEAEAEAAGKVAQQQKFYSIVAIIIGGLGIFVAARFVHLPMERFIISATAEIARNQKKAEAASEAKSVFLATMSHEIRTPLNGVMGLSELLQESETDPDRRRLLDMIVSSGHSLLQVINDVLDLSKIEAGKIELDTNVFDARVLCEEVVELYKVQAHAKDIELHLIVEPEHASWRMKAPGKAVRQIVLNLVNNAVKFTDAGAVTVRLRFGASSGVLSASGRRMVQVCVEDSGIGISSDALPHIFDQFAQADSSTTTRYGGTGLGLAIAKQLGDAMGGGLTVTSEAGAGSEFCLSFPAIPHAPAAPASKAEPEDFRFHGKVLVADDNRVNLLVAERMLLKLGCTVKTATNGIQAVAMQRTWEPDLILMDVRMPEMDGLEATNILRGENAGTSAGPVPIIGLSANALKEHQDEGYAAGMNGYLTKPLKKAALVAELRRHLTFVRREERKDECA